MSMNERPKTSALIFTFTDLPFDGLSIETAVGFKELYRPEEVQDEELNKRFHFPIKVAGTITPVASKVDIRGQFSTRVEAPCDRCNAPCSVELKGPLDTFLMASSQFSDHDKPGGKVIHGPTRDTKPSRHHSKTKALILTDAEGEHEDDSFGAFDGQHIDLRPILKELLILQLPMRFLCSESCKGLCLVCGGDANRAQCTCKAGPTLVSSQEGTKEPSFFALELQKRFKK